MKVTYNDIIRASGALKKLSEKELPIKQAIALSRLVKKLNGEIEIFSQEQRQLVEKYGIINQETGDFKIPVSKQKEYSDKMTELLTFQVEIETEKVEINSLDNIEAAVIMDTELFIDFKA